MQKLKAVLRQALKRHESLYRLLRALRTRLRCWLYGLRHVDKTAYIAGNSSLSRDIKVGPYAYVGPASMICAGVQIGAYSMLGPRVTIVGRDHSFDVPGVPIIFAGRPEHLPTVIEADVWIGACATLIGGIRIGRGSVIGAGSVVTRDVPPFTVVAGVPARVLRNRFDEKGIENHEEMLKGPIIKGKFCADVEN